jgi:hypothetical protein
VRQEDPQWIFRRLSTSATKSRPLENPRDITN